LVAGAGDQVAGFLGAGLVEPGQLIDVAGTFPVFATCLDRCLVDTEQGILQPLAGPLGDKHWYAMMYIGGGGLTHHWFVEQLAQDKLQDMTPAPAPISANAPSGAMAGAMADAAGKWQRAFAALDEAAAELPPGAQGLLFIPHLLGRACPPDPSVRGAWLGFTWTHTRAHLYRALLEAIAYDYAQALDVLRTCCPQIALDSVRVIGGGAASGAWNQIKADVLGLPYTRLAAGDRAALGCAILGGHAVGIFPDMAAAAARLAQPHAAAQPRAAWHAHYRGYVNVYRRAYGQLHDLYESLAELDAAPWPPIV
jgi:xylulokinase